MLLSGVAQEGECRCGKPTWAEGISKHILRGTGSPRAEAKDPEWLKPPDGSLIHVEVWPKLIFRNESGGLLKNGSHCSTVELAIQPFVHAHDVARGLDQTAELLSNSENLDVLGLVSHRTLQEKSSVQ